MSNRAWMKKMRIARSLSQTALGKLVSVSQDTISKIENNQRNPSIKLAKKLSTVLEVKWTKFFEEEQ